MGGNRILQYMVGDVRDRDRLNLAIRNVDIVFHAAAMKHIDICEENPFDAVKTNVVGTSNILEASIIENISKRVINTIIILRIIVPIKKNYLILIRQLIY